MILKQCSSAVISRRFSRHGFVALLVWLVIGYTTGQASDICNGEDGTIECESENYEYKGCPMDEPRAVIVSAKISIKHSKSACHFYNGSLAQNYNSSGEFGFTENVLWVHGGCNARFEICYVVTNVSTTRKLTPSSSVFSTSSVSTLLTHSSVFHTETTEKAEPGDVPVAAIVVPVLSIAILVVTVLLFILWRRRKLGKAMESTKLKVMHHAAEHGKTSIESGAHAEQHGSEEHYYTDIEQQNQNKAVVPTTKSISYDKQKANFDGQGHTSGEPVYSNDKVGANDVIIQTLPDEEYNVIGIEPNKMVADNNYDTLKHDRRPGNVEYSQTSDLK